MIKFSPKCPSVSLREQQMKLNHGPSSSSSEPTIYVMVPNGNSFLALSLAKRVAKKRKRSTLPSMVITSSPVKQELERKDIEKKAKQKKEEKDTNARKSLQFGKATKEVTRDAQDENTTCPRCNEEYEDPPQTRSESSVASPKSGGMKAVPIMKV
ncbi:hypothetical protein C0J52_22306 [Blattella germanica]|nr:hypothetical protein C0J52_22306 [Blattella germanica]